MKKKLNVLTWGASPSVSAVREKILSSKYLNKIYYAGIEDSRVETPKNRLRQNGWEFIEDIKENNIDIFFTVNELFLKVGGVDAIRENTNTKVFVPPKKWFKLESSKTFALDFMKKYNIKTPKYKIIKNLDELKESLSDFSYPLVLKADGLCAGLGVFIVKNKEDVLKTFDFMRKEFKSRTKKIIVEEFIKGEEVTFISVWDGKHLKSLLPARDFKKLKDGDKGVNTGGMGAYAPVYLTESQLKALKSYEKTLESALLKEKADFTGFISSGLIFKGDELYVLEYNMRMPDTEGTVLLNLLENDILEVFQKTVEGKLNELKLKWKKGVSGCVTLAGKDYTKNHSMKGRELSIPRKSEKVKFMFAVPNSFVCADSARYAFVVGYDEKNPFPFIYEEIEKYLSDNHIESTHYRKDIGRYIENKL